MSNAAYGCHTREGLDVAGVEPASETTQTRRLRAFPLVMTRKRGEGRALAPGGPGFQVSRRSHHPAQLVRPYLATIQVLTRP